MASPINGEFNLTLGRSDLPLTENHSETPNSAGDNLNSGQSAKSSNSKPHVTYAPSLSKRKKSKPKRFDVSRADVPKENPPPEINIVPNSPSSPSLSLVKVTSPIKTIKTPIPNSPAMIRAQEVQSKLGNEFPVCVKMMVRSQVTSGFWLGLPLQFCKTHLPKDDVPFVLEDENGEQFEVKYIAYKFGLSAGWKNFAVRHQLAEGDVLVFHLVQTTKFKIYILKANDSCEIDGALSFLNLEAHTEKINQVTPSPKRKKNKVPDYPSLTMVNKKSKKSNPSLLSGPRIEQQSENDSEEVGSEVLEDSSPNISFQEMKTFEDFHIVVKGVCIDRELPGDIRISYYKLCSYNKQFLHDGLQENLYPMLVAGMIGQTVNIANEIKNCKLTATKEEFEKWDTSLKSCEIMGMKVDFLREQIRALEKLMFNSKGAKEYVDAKKEQKRVEDEMNKLAKELEELKVNAEKLEVISASLKQKTHKFENKVKREIDVPW